jgi:hypothetical protein
MVARVLGLVLFFWTCFGWAGQWRYSDETDKMTGKKASYAMIESDNTLSLSWPYGGVNKARLYVRKHPSHGLDVFMTIDKGQILCRSYDPCRVVVRFGEEKPRNFSGLGSADHSADIVFLQPESAFIAAARKHKKILVQVPMYQAGEQVLEFTSPVELVWK